MIDWACAGWQWDDSLIGFIAGAATATTIIIISFFIARVIDEKERRGQYVKNMRGSL